MQYNAVIREYSNQSLKILARILVADLKDFPADWQVRYKNKLLDRETTNSIQDLCCCPGNPLQIYKPVKNGFPISVRTLDGQQIEVTVSKTDTVKILKLKIFQENQSFPAPSQELYICRQDRQFCLNDQHNLEFYGICSGSVLYAKTKQNWLIDYTVEKKFKAIDLESSYAPLTSDVVSQKVVPSWAKFSAGINLCGACPNPDCVSKKSGFESRVTIHLIQYGDLQLNFADKTEKLLNCPACSSVPVDKVVQDAKTEKLVDIDGDREVEEPEPDSTIHQIIPNSLIVSSARLLMRRKKIGEVDIWRIVLQSKGPGNDYTSCKLGENLGQVEITSVEPWRSPYICVRCDTGIMFKAQEIHLPCRHVYHQWCMPSILKGIQCKACTAKILIVGGMSDVFKVV